MKQNKEKLLHELLAEAQEAKTRVERIEIFKDNDTFALRTILQLAYSKSIELDFPTGAPPYKVSTAPAGLELSRLKNIIKPLGSCVKGNKTPSFKKEKILIGILESVHAKDAEIIIAAKDKTLSKLYSKITENLVEKTFPSLLK
jgi:hypothetical protein|tara:strand:- start:1729 stop:2160 length:432 start_codon:yes stop_codon:yes gene_type:complete